LDALPAVVTEADGLPVWFDSGVRSGADLIRALGARRNRRVVARTSTAWLSKARTASSTYCAHCLPKPT
jgi:lactate 2-monooxygenase